MALAAPFGRDDPHQAYLCSFCAQQLEPALKWVSPDHPVGLMLIFGILSTQPGSLFAFKLATTTMETCGLAENHFWSLILPTSSRVPQQVYKYMSLSSPYNTVSYVALSFMTDNWYRNPAGGLRQTHRLSLHPSGPRGLQNLQSY